MITTLVKAIYSTLPASLRFIIYLQYLIIFLLYFAVDVVGIIMERGSIQYIYNARNEQEKFLELVIGDEM